MSKLVTADCGFICGHLRYGHWEVELTDSEYMDFCNMEESEKERFIEYNGHLVIDDYEIDDIGEPTDIQVYDE